MKNIINAISILERETGESWYKITEALASKDIISKKQQRKVEGYFFIEEDKKQVRV